MLCAVSRGGENNVSNASRAREFMWSQTASKHISALQWSDIMWMFLFFAWWMARQGEMWFSGCLVDLISGEGLQNLRHRAGSMMYIVYFPHDQHSPQLSDFADHRQALLWWLIKANRTDGSSEPAESEESCEVSKLLTISHLSRSLENASCAREQ